MADTADYPGGLVWPNAAFASVLGLAALESLERHQASSHYARFLGIGLAAGGLGLRLWAFTSIGSDFLRAPGECRRLLMQGPYSAFRHPAGWGLASLASGFSLAVASTWGLVAVVALLLPSLIWAHRREEAANCEAGLLPCKQTFSQRLMAHPLCVLLYEPVVHPLFLIFFTRHFRFESIYRQLLSLAKQQGIPAGTTILDLACGSAWFARRIARESSGTGVKIIGSRPLSLEMLNRAATAGGAAGDLARAALEASSGRRP